MAECVKERERCRNAVCLFPITDFSQLITTLETRGEANAYDNVTKLLYEKYHELVEVMKEQMAKKDEEGVTNE